MEPADLIALSAAPGTPLKRQQAASASANLDNRLETALELLAPGEPAAALAARLRQQAAALLRQARRFGIDVVPRGDPRYPPLLAVVPDAPLVLWVAGNPDVLTGPAVAIVGSRSASHASLEVAARIARDLAPHVVVVSGLARGCDAAAHVGALDGGGVTVGVLGTGPDMTYPAEHRQLACEVRASGALVSELSPGTPPLPHHFPLRNRIISGLSAGVLVIEAGERSGSLITASCALEQGRAVMAVPGTVLGGRNRGSHALLRDGARLVETADDVLEEIFGVGTVPPAAPGARSAASVAGGDDPVLAQLEEGDGLGLDELAARTGLAPGALLARLGRLEMTGAARRLAGGRFVRLKGKVIT